MSGFEWFLVGAYFPMVIVSALSVATIARLEQRIRKLEEENPSE